MTMTAINSPSLFLNIAGMTLATAAIRLREAYRDRVANTYAKFIGMMLRRRQPLSRGYRAGWTAARDGFRGISEGTLTTRVVRCILTAQE
jgi:hypothetical protein